LSLAHEQADEPTREEEEILLQAIILAAADYGIVSIAEALDLRAEDVVAMLYPVRDQIDAWPSN